MSAQTAPGIQEVFVHEAAIYGSDEEFLGIVVPFLRDGAAAADPVLLGIDRRREQLVRDALGDVSGVTFLADAERYDRPQVTLQANQDLFTSLAKGGATQIRIVGQIPHPGIETAWEGWARYEAIINRVYATLPVWAICPYDTRDTPAYVLADVERTHPTLITSGGNRHASERFEDPAAFLAGRPRPDPDPLQDAAPAVDLANPSIADSRRAVAGAAGHTRLGDEEVEGLVLGVSEAVTNARVHGRPPVRVRAWTAPDRIVVTVSDTGPGPADPFAGFAPSGTDAGTGGFGLWITHQTCHQVDHIVTDEGFTLRLIMSC